MAEALLSEAESLAEECGSSAATTLAIARLAAASEFLDRVSQVRVLPGYQQPCLRPYPLRSSFRGADRIPLVL
jgi:hypothetical protein